MLFAARILAAACLEIVDEFQGDLREKFDKSKCKETFMDIFWVAGIEALGHQSQLWHVPAAVIRGPEEDRIVSGSRSTVEIQQAAKAALLAGAAEVFRVCEVPEGWNKVEGKQIVAAAIEANTLTTGTDRIDAAFVRLFFVDAPPKSSWRFGTRGLDNTEEAGRKAYAAALVNRAIANKAAVKSHAWSRMPHAAGTLQNVPG
jgi:hypothetical protein